jgi:hypothetical protein
LAGGTGKLTVNYLLIFMVCKFLALELSALGSLMYRVVEAVRQTDLARLLNDIHSWLDHSRCSFDCLSIERETFDIIVIELAFDNLDIAKDFVRAFQGWALFPPIISEPV